MGRMRDDKKVGADKTAKKLSGRCVKLYLAGPDVFRPDAEMWAAAARAACHRHGHLALLPLAAAQTAAPEIFRSNLRLLNEADAVIANLNPFRGQEPDSGTCVEIGYALALGKPVLGYADSLRPLRERLQASGADTEGRFHDASGWTVEDFGLPFNLMLAVPLPLIEGRLEDALFQVAACLKSVSSF